jgi:xanthine dehydrogenase large subunit
MKSSSIPHDSSITHVAGESEYIDDRPMLAGELFVGCFYLRVATTDIDHIDTSLALKIPGVEAVVTAKDVAHNAWGPIFQDQPIIADRVTMFAGEVLAVVGATTPEALRKGLAAIKIRHRPRPSILTISDAVARKSLIGGERCIKRGNVDSALNASPMCLKGKLVIKGADHFYLENQSAVAYPKENGQMEVHASTQHPTETQHVVAEALGVNFSDVVCIVKRLGGGFGGKESQSSPIAAYAALIARKTNRAARIVLTKDDDMIMTGKRNPFEIHYDVGFDRSGKILALKSRLYSDGGAYADLSTAIMERAMLHSDNAYFIGDVEVIGQVCKTNMHPHTAFRGFGGPKGVAVIEGVIEDMARELNMDALDIRKANVYQDGRDVTHYGQKVENNRLPTQFSALEKSADYRRRRADISRHNRAALAAKSRFSAEGDKLRGLSMTAVKFGISFTTKFLNQGNALVQVHRDGSIQVSTGAVEMGQGVNTRIAMLVAEELGVPVDRVRVMTTSTEKNANTSPTAASTGTDINGAAAVLAARKIRERLASLAVKLKAISPENWPSKTAGLGSTPEIDISAPDANSTMHTVFHANVVKLGNQDDRANNRSARVSSAVSEDFAVSFPDLVNEAYLSRISLGEYGYHRTENLGFDKLKGQGQAFQYFTQGVAASEVEVDRLTGEVKVRRVDILMDLGRPINEGLDLGQVTGAFIQGMGWVTTENLVYDNEGFLLSHSPSTYKIPSIQDTPRVFNVQLDNNLGNIANIRGTKAVGEPPLLLAISVWSAIKDAVRYASEGDQENMAFNNTNLLGIPATAEQILRHLEPGRFAAIEKKSTNRPVEREQARHDF